VQAGSAHSFIIGRYDDVAGLEPFVEVLGVLPTERRRALVGRTGCAVGPGDDRASPWRCWCRGHEQQTGHGDIGAVDRAGVIHDPVPLPAWYGSQILALDERAGRGPPTAVTGGRAAPR
jgi:hypothetical protein